jgi:hypothetical protein
MLQSSQSLRVVALVAVLAALGCAEDETVAPAGPAVTAIYVVPSDPSPLAGEHWLDHPWPSDLRLVDGRVSWAGFYVPRDAAISDYIAIADRLLDGFSVIAGGYLRFDGALDPTSLPADPGAAAQPTSSVQLVDVDPASPSLGARVPIETSYREQPGIYLLPSTLSWLPAFGFPLRPHNRYALVATDTLRGAGGLPVRPSADLAAVLGLADGTPQAAAFRDSLAPAVTALEQAGVARASIVHLAVFTTADAVGELLALRDDVAAAVPAPTVPPTQMWTVADRGGFWEYQARYGPSPNYQHGTPPYANPEDGGDFVFVAGVPQLESTFDLRFSLSVPDCPMPAAGYPVALYAHGTGGDWRSYIDDGTAAATTAECIAMMGVDQIFHGDRPGHPANPADQNFLFFNYLNVAAARANGRQSAIDEVQRARLFTEGAFEIPAAVSHTGAAIHFDPARILYFGHSQGALNGPLFMAADPAARGGVLSGAGSIILVTLLEKTEPAEASVAKLFPGLFLALNEAEAADELDFFHPGPMLVQSLIDVVDPAAYASLLVREPRAGHAPKSVLFTEGIAPDGSGDNYSPPKGIEAHAIAVGLPLQLPAQRPYPQLDYGAPAAVAIPPAGLAGNLAGGAASGVLAQWLPATGSDGHFVVFDVPAARAQAAGFLRRLADDAAGGVPPP